MIIVNCGIIQFGPGWQIIAFCVRLVKFIKTRSPVIHAGSRQVTGREVAYNCLEQRHEVPLNPALVK